MSSCVRRLLGWPLWSWKEFGSLQYWWFDLCCTAHSSIGLLGEGEGERRSLDYCRQEPCRYNVHASGMRATRLLVYIPAFQGVFSVPVTGPRNSLGLPKLSRSPQSISNPRSGQHRTPRMLQTDFHLKAVVVLLRATPQPTVRKPPLIGM